MTEIDAGQMNQIRYLGDSFGWSISTLLMCLIGQSVHWLMSYSRARKASKAVGTPMPSLWLYWYGDWPTTLASFLIVFAGYFMLPEIATTFPTFGQAMGMYDDKGHPVGLSMLTSFLWGMAGNTFADFAGRRLTKLVAE
jgi:hypothetical protein